MDTLYFSTLDSPIEVDPDIYLPDIQLVDTQTIDCNANFTIGNIPPSYPTRYMLLGEKLKL